MPLRLALVGGPMYDGLYRLLDGQAVEVVVHADHPALNRRAAELLALAERGQRFAQPIPRELWEALLSVP